MSLPMNSKDVTKALVQVRDIRRKIELEKGNKKKEDRHNLELREGGRRSSTKTAFFFALLHTLFA